MLAQRFIAICDRKGCKDKTKATVTLKTAQVARGTMEPIVLIPTNIVFAEEGWSFGWNGDTKTTEVHCSRHGGKNGSERKARGSKRD